MLKNALSLFIFTVVILGLFLPSYSKMQDLKQKNEDFARRITELERKTVRLGNEKNLLETDPEYLEKVGREKMGLIREGEKVYKIVPEKK